MFWISDLIFCFLALFLPCLLFSNLDYTSLIRAGFIYSSLALSLTYLLGLVHCTHPNKQTILMYLTALSCASIIFLVLTPYAHASYTYMWLSTILIFFSVPFATTSWFLSRFIVNRQTPHRTNALLIGTKKSIEKTMHHPSLRPVAAVCFDDASECIGDLLNLGNLDDLPTILRDVDENAKLTIVAEQLIAEQIQKIVRCPVLSIKPHANT